MYRLSDNYYQRKCYVAREQVPTQSIMKQKMCPSLANVYFKSMSPKLKVLAGLEPPLKGGGGTWYMPPEEMLAGRSVLKPLKSEHLKKLGFFGIDELGAKICRQHHRARMEEKRQHLLESNDFCRKCILNSNKQQYEDSSKFELECNAIKTRHIIRQFEALFKTSINNIETILFDAAVKEINQIREDTFLEMKERYEKYVKYQATSLHNDYQAKMTEIETQIKAKFIKEAQDLQTNVSKIVHDLKVEKHTTIEKIRHVLQCQNLSSQIYVILKEREECQKEIEQVEYQYKKEISELKEKNAIKDYEIQLQLELQSKRKQVDKNWTKKMSCVVRNLQMFILYCLKTMPQHAELFLNMEKLMLLQLSQAVESPYADSIIELEPEVIETSESESEPNPFYLFCDKGYKPAHVDQNLCPKHCTSSTSHLPVVVINGRYIYSACDNFEIISEKVTQYLAGHYGDDHLEVDHNYELAVPVKCTSSMQLQELNLESSIMKLLQKELVDRKELPVECVVCKQPNCFCGPLYSSEKKTSTPPVCRDISMQKFYTEKNIESRQSELQLQREPKWESYLEYVTPKKCKCSKFVKKHWEEHLPSYMRKMSSFEPPELPNYELCKLDTLKKLVKRAKGVNKSAVSEAKFKVDKKDVSTQYTDQEYDSLCNCLSHDSITMVSGEVVELKHNPLHSVSSQNLIANVNTAPRSTVSYMSQSTNSFVTHRAYSLKKMLNEAPYLEETFRNFAYYK